MHNAAEFVLANWDAIAGIVATLVGWLVSRPIIAERKAKADAWLRQHRLDAAVDVASGVVAEIYRTTVRELKASGQFDDAAKARIAGEAAAALRRELQDHGLALLNHMAPALIEIAINRMKGSALSVASVDGPELDQ